MIKSDIAPALSIVVPCYNEKDSLAELHTRVLQAVEPVVGKSFELVLVDDGSTDGTTRMIEDLSQACPHTVGLVLSRNHGHQKALSAGLKYCRGARIYILDADLQDPPELLGPMMQLMDDGADVVYGQRKSRDGETISKSVSASLFYRLLNRMTDVDIPLDTGDFRLLSRKVLDHLNDMPEEDRFVRGMVSWLGFTQVPLLYDRAERFAGETKYPLRKMMRLAIDAITGFSIVPLRIATILSAVAALLSVVMIVYVLAQWALGHVVAGWSSVMVVVLTVSSVQLLTIGILGEYLGRLYMQSKKRPLFIVDRFITGKTAAKAKTVKSPKPRQKQKQT